MFDLSAALELSSCVKTKSGAAALNELRMRITGTVVKNGMCRFMTWYEDGTRHGQNAISFDDLVTI